ncbi:MAG: YadA-like family protein [Erythrobacter sp.]|jgi:autotransporter adhesin
MVSISQIVMPQAAHAQALTPVVDLCTGVSIDQSSVQSLLAAVNEPIVSPIESVVNSVLGLTAIIPGISLLSPLNIDVTGIVDNGVAGNPIGVQVLDTNGTLVGPSNCNITTDGYTLNTQGGIAIGGNSITGLGVNGLAASAGELDAIAFGNSASTAVGATGAVAIGTGASVTTANGVALGAGSLADRGALTGYTAAFLAGTHDSVGSVSVGAAGSLRQITNVAPGTGATDAATVGQVQAALDTALASSALSLQYDDVTNTQVTLAGAGGTLITNVASGTLDAASTDAVNGSQLYATNQTVAANTAAIAGLDGRVTVNEGDIASLDGRVTVNETDIANLDGRVTIAYDRLDILDNSVTGIDARVTQNTTLIAGIQTQIANVPVGYVDDADGVTSSATPTNTAAFTGASGGPVRVTNVADGTLAAGSSDAVNGSQLYDTRLAVAQNRVDIDQNTADIAALNSNIAGSTVVAVQYSNPGTPTLSNGGTITNDVTLVGADAGAPVALHNVANGIAATDAVNLGQLDNGLQSVLTNATNYTDLRFAQIGFDLSELRTDAFSGTASAIALGTIPQTLEAGKALLGGSIGHYRGETAFGFGFSAASGDGKAVFRFNGTVDTHGKGGFAAGAGIAF